MRPCFLVVDNEYPASISSRKLVLETAKINVITAYSAAEAVETLARFPGVDGVVLDSEIRGTTCEELVKRLRAVRRNVEIVVVSPGGHHKCDGETHQVANYDPRLLLEELSRIRSKETQEIARHDEEIGRRFAGKPGQGESDG
jgi:response regulator RpfG family c-di-GMP phosphodiesterase